MGFGTELLFVLVLGVLLIKPTKLPAILGKIARAKAQLQSAGQNFKSQLEVNLVTQTERTDFGGKTGEEQ